MNKYFVSFISSTNGNCATGNTIVETNVKITDFDNIEDMCRWLKDLQKWIEQQGAVRNVIITNFILLN